MSTTTATTAATNTPEPISMQDALLAQAAALREHAAALREYAAAMRQDNRSSPFVSADDAAAYLGFKLTKTGHHLRRLKELRDRGLLVTFGQQHPFTYNRAELEDLLKKKEKGKLFF